MTPHVILLSYFQNISIRNMIPCTQCQNQALQTLAHMATGYAEAVSSAMPGVRVAPSKLKSSNTVSKAVKRLNVKVLSILFNLLTS
jgi:hypothetical protein